MTKTGETTQVRASATLESGSRITIRVMNMNKDGDPFDVDAHVFGVWAAHPVCRPDFTPSPTHWTITHVPTGKNIGWQGDAECCVDVARILGGAIGDATEYEVKKHRDYIFDLCNEAGMVR